MRPAKVSVLALAKARMESHTGRIGVWTTEESEDSLNWREFTTRQVHPVFLYG
jgi:hypothetical protein